MVYQTKFSEQEVAQAKQKTQQTYGTALALYATPPSLQEIEDALRMLKDARIELAWQEFRQVASRNQKNSSCGCSGKSSPSAGRYSTKSQKPQYFAKHYQAMDYDTFCARFPDFCRG
jgi:hypothetical protein